MDEQLYLLALGLSYQEKLDKAIATLRHYEAVALQHDPENGYYLGDSYGKDSCVILDLVKRAEVKFKAYHHLTTMDPPELVRFGRRHHPDTHINRPLKPLLARLVETSNGPPTRIARWCCAEFKEGARWGNRRIDEAQNHAVKAFGVRAAESARRKANWKVLTPHRQTGSPILNPILYWSDEDVWRHLKENSIPYCCLYDEGFSRLGCIGCPMAGSGRRVQFDRWPGYEKAWKNAVRKFWDKWHGVPRRDGKPRWFDCPRPNGRIFSKWEDLWEWWMEELDEPKEDDCQMGLF